MGNKFAFALLWLSFSVGAIEVNLTWDLPSDLTGITGYELHYGNASNLYHTSKSLNPDVSATGVETGDSHGADQWFFAIRSVGDPDTTISSLFSNEVAVDAVTGEPVFGAPAPITEWQLSYEQGGGSVADLKRTVAAGGGEDHTTVQDAWTYILANHDFDDGKATIEITDTSTYTISSHWNIAGPYTGSLSATNYLEITSTADDPFSGPTLEFTHTLNSGMTLDIGYVHMHNLALKLDSTGNGTEILRVDGDYLLLERIYFYSIDGQNSQEGILVNNRPATQLSIVNCVFNNFWAAAIYVNGGTSRTQTVYIENTTIIQDQYVGIRAYENSGSTTMNVYNTMVIDNDASADYAFYDQSGTPTWTGSNNIAWDATAESRFTDSYDSVDAVETEPSSGENAWLTEINTSTETDIDVSVVGENAYTVTQNGIDRSSSLADSRADLTIDIMGNNRKATPTIGAFEYITAGGGATPKLNPLRGILHGVFGGPL